MSPRLWLLPLQFSIWVPQDHMEERDVYKVLHITPQKKSQVVISEDLGGHFSTHWSVAPPRPIKRLESSVFRYVLTKQWKCGGILSNWRTKLSESFFNNGINQFSNIARKDVQLQLILQKRKTHKVSCKTWHKKHWPWENPACVLQCHVGFVFPKFYNCACSFFHLSGMLPHQKKLTN